MSWVIWRQHRAQAAWVLLLVAALCGLMLWVRARATADVVDLRAAGCLLGDISGTGCQAPLDDFAVRYNFTIPAFELGVPLVLAVTAALGRVWRLVWVARSRVWPRPARCSPPTSPTAATVALG
jgi:hypothetical protein